MFKFIKNIKDSFINIYKRESKNEAQEKFFIERENKIVKKIVSFSNKIESSNLFKLLSTRKSIIFHIVLITLLLSICFSIIIIKIFNLDFIFSLILFIVVISLLSIYTYDKIKGEKK